MSHNFKAGQRVICITNKFQDAITKTKHGSEPKMNEIVTVESLSIVHLNCLCLKEHKFSPIDGRRESYQSAGFRPLQLFEESSSKEILEKFKITEEKAEILQVEPKIELV